MLKILLFLILGILCMFIAARYAYSLYFKIAVRNIEQFNERANKVEMLIYNLPTTYEPFVWIESEIKALKKMNRRNENKIAQLINKFYDRFQDEARKDVLREFSKE